MKFATVLTCLLASCIFPAVAIAQPAASDITDKGEANVNEERPALPAVAADSPAGRFSDRGQLTISSDAGLEVSSKSTRGVDGSAVRITLRPAVDYFVANNISVGGFVGLDYTKASDSHATLFSVGPRVGYNLAFGERFSFWPKLGFSFATLSSKSSLPASESASESHLAMNFFAPVVFHPVQHFFLGFGPALDTDLTGDFKSTTIAGRLTLGGWL